MNKAVAIKVSKIEDEINTIDGTIQLCNTLKRGETVELNGLHKFNVTRGNFSDSQFNEIIQKLELERKDLWLKLSIIKKNV